MQYAIYGRLLFVAALIKTPMYFVTLYLLWREVCLSHVNVAGRCVLLFGVYIFITERNHYMRRAKRAVQGMQLHYRAQRYSAERSEAQRERSDHLSILLAVAEGEPLRKIRCERQRASLSKRSAQSRFILTKIVY